MINCKKCNDIGEIEITENNEKVWILCECKVVIDKDMEEFGDIE